MNTMEEKLRLRKQFNDHAIQRQKKPYTDIVFLGKIKTFGFAFVKPTQFNLSFWFYKKNLLLGQN